MNFFLIIVLVFYTEILFVFPHTSGKTLHFCPVPTYLGKHIMLALSPPTWENISFLPSPHPSGKTYHFCHVSTHLGKHIIFAMSPPIWENIFLPFPNPFGKNILFCLVSTLYRQTTCGILILNRNKYIACVLWSSVPLFFFSFFQSSHKGNYSRMSFLLII